MGYDSQTKTIHWLDELILNQKHKQNEELYKRKFGKIPIQFLRSVTIPVIPKASHQVLWETKKPSTQMFLFRIRQLAPQRRI